jgi:ABC-2 type transport system ATP-binding protein
VKNSVELKNVTKKIGKKLIIDDLSFQVKEGEVFGFLGPNGAGKTTTIRMIVGLISITNGDIKIFEKSIKSEREEAIQSIGAIVENPEMYKFLSGYDNLIHFARMSGKVNKQKIQEVVELVGLQNRIHQKVKTYSLGMRQRLGIAQALLHDPKVLILDEPTNGLDPSGIRETREYVRTLATEKGISVIVSSHLLSEIELMCDRYAIIHKGKLIEVQSVQEMNQSITIKIGIEVNDPDLANNTLGGIVQSIQIEGKKIIIETERTEIPKLIKQLVEKEIEIYEVKEIARTLEERFIEVTTGGGPTNV